MLVSAESQVPKLISREIIFAEFQREWSQSTNITDGRMDGRTDNLSWQYRATLRFVRQKWNLKCLHKHISIYKVKKNDCC